MSDAASRPRSRRRASSPAIRKGYRAGVRPSNARRCARIGRESLLRVGTNGGRETGITMLCSVAGRPCLSDERLRVRSDGGMTHNHAGGSLCLESDLSPAAASLDWPVT
jgi:hypothetical protein